MTTANIRSLRVNPPEHEALQRLLAIGAGPTDQSRRVADFLLAWWNSGSCGAFDLTTSWGLDEAIGKDLVTVFALIVRCGSYPDALGYEEDFKNVIAQWRPELKD